jgi:hypothetical protein
MLEEFMIDQSDAGYSRTVESEVDRAQRREARRPTSPWSYLVGLLAVAAIIALGFALQDNSPAASFRASTGASAH